jgi:ABC-2 type transport system ATP-binding protein
VSENAVTLQDIRMEFPGVVALNSVNFSVAKGSVHGFLGPNGSGKTTTIKIISGLLRPTAGSVIWPAGVPPANGIGVLPETPPLYAQMRVQKYLEFVAALYLPRQQRKSEVTRAMEECGLSDCGHRVIAPLSKGYKQRIGIAQAIIFSPDLVILDEPTVGLDPHSISQVRELITNLKKRCTVILSSHNLSEVERICDQVTILNRGAVVTSGQIEEIKHRFQGSHQVVAQVKTWSEVLSRTLCLKLPNCKVLNYRHEAGRYEVRVSFDGSERELTKLSSLLVEIGEALFQIQEDDVDLEQIFQHATGDSGSGENS